MSNPKIFRKQIEKRNAAARRRVDSDPTGNGGRVLKMIADTPRTSGAITERKFRELAAAAGYSVTKRGWPDFILEKEGRIIFVEVKKNPRTGLKRDQARIAKILVAAGLEVFLWNPETGFQKVLLDTP